MPYILMREYDTDLMGLNEDLYHAYIESHTGTGGERRVIYLRQHEKGLPITLRAVSYTHLTLPTNREV